MKKEQFKKIFEEEAGDFSNNQKYVNTPDDWKELKKDLNKFVKNVDEAAEVYELENGNKGQK